MKFQCILLVLLLGVYHTSWAQKFYVVAPNTLRLSSDETIAVAIEGSTNARGIVFIQDHPGKITNVSKTNLILHPGEPQLFKVRLEPSSFPPSFLSGPDPTKYVSLNFHSERYRKEIIIPITVKSGYVFIQTDKPIYTPKQHAQIRIIQLNEEEIPSDRTIKLQIKNPKGLVVLEKPFNRTTQRVWKMFQIYTYKFPIHPVPGIWSANVLYGYNFDQNSTVQFELREYVLPTFTVKLETKEVILPTSEIISAKVTAMHVYGKPVQGFATFKVGVKRKETEPKVFRVFGPKNLIDGSSELKIRTDDIKTHTDIGWFPEIEGSHLVIEAIVVDSATGNEETVIDSKGRFSTSPFVISFERCLQDFKPGLVSVFEANINYIDGKPASGISTLISAMADGQPLNIGKNTATSDEDGKVSFEIHPEIKHSNLSITIETNDPRYIGSQAKKSFLQKKFVSPQKAYVALSRSTPRSLLPGEMFAKEVHFEPSPMPDTYYLAVSKGKILFMNKLPHGEFKVQRIEFPITHDMVPSFRVVVFAYYNEELIADSLKIDVERACKPNAEVSFIPDFPDTEPGNNGKIIISGTSGTLVGLLGVDEAVYALSKRDLLTKDKIFNTIESHDLGCGPGGGLNTNFVLGNAGIVIGTNTDTAPLQHSCGEVRRRKREAAEDIVNTYNEFEKQCCALGIQDDEYNRNCDERTKVVEDTLNGEYPNCTKAFMDCCVHAEENGLTKLKLKNKVSLGRTFGEDFEQFSFEDILDEEILEKETTARTDFRETWIFDDILIGPDNREEYSASLPHSITTWVIQAVSVSPSHGICISKPKKLVSFKKIFLHLNLPYSVFRNEQVEIQATLFNYGMKNITAFVYMYGAKDLCTGAVAGQKSERKTLYVDGQSAQSVSFPVVPLKVQDFPIKVVAFTSEGTDVIEKRLHAVPEGVSQEFTIPIKLDPSNQQNRQERSTSNEIYTDTIVPSDNLQITAVKLRVPEGFVPGTASCYITAIGDHFGTVVETAVNRPGDLLVLPTGCGEQNMMRLAPTLYAMRYLKITGKITPELEEKGYGYMREGYDNQLKHRRSDGSFAIYNHKPASTWLTAFVMKVFCQASELIYIDENVICSGIRWLINNQEPDGSYIDYNPVYAKELMGGIDGKPAVTAFTLITLHECKCDQEDLILAKGRALSYVETHLGEVNTKLATAITAYALALSDSSLKDTINDKLLSLATYDERANLMHWETENSAQDVETAGYALLTQLALNDMEKSCSIVNWLNTQQLKSGTYKSTQDTVVALQSLSEYAIRAQMPSLNLISNISSSNDRTFHEVIKFTEDNAFILQDVKVNKLGGTLFINTAGHGVGSLAVKLRYNIIVPPEQTCKFDIAINVTEIKEDPNLDIINQRRRNKNQKYPDQVIDNIAHALHNDVPAVNIIPRNRERRSVFEMTSRGSNINNSVVLRAKRQSTAGNSKMKLKISICLRHLGNKDAERSIVDAGIFSGFVPMVEDLQELQDSPDHFVESFEKSSTGVIFYLEIVPSATNYCFSFRVIREYIVGNTQSSVIKVYEYYNPDETCTKFYKPKSNTAMVRTICDGGICECLEGGCPPKNPFEETEGLNRVEKRDRLKQILCDNYDYVWNGTLNGNVRKEGGFFNISFMINHVIKEGIEKREDIEGETRTLLARDNCQIANMLPGVTYLVLGNDGEKYQNSNGAFWYRYILDKTSAIYMSTLIKQSPNKELERGLKYAANALSENGCEL